MAESTQPKAINDLSPDGRYVAFDTSSGSLAELWVLPLFGDRKPFPFVQGKFRAASAQFSPDGHFIAYTSSESGRNEVYVQTFPEQHAKWQISTDGGAEPMWRHDGKELFYLAPAKLMAVEVKTDSNSLQAGIPRPLFESPWLLSIPSRNRYVVTPDGQRFLFNVPTEAGEISMINVVVNWPAGLRK